MDHVPPSHQHDARYADGLDGAVDPLSGTGSKRWLLLALTTAALLACLALGVWQVERRAWKLALIERVEARIHAPPAPLPPRAAWPSLDARNAEYRRVQVTGRFRHDRETLVQAVTVQGPGYWVLTPLQAEGATVLVNRGFVPPERRAPDSRAPGQVAGPVTITGLVRMSEPGGGFLRANDPASERWYSRDVAAIARARALGPATAPFFVDADRTPNPGGYPVGGLTVVRFPNTHLVYAVTWFGLAGLCGLALARMLRARREPRG